MGSGATRAGAAVAYAAALLAFSDLSFAQTRRTGDVARVERARALALGEARRARAEAAARQRDLSALDARLAAADARRQEIEANLARLESAAATASAAAHTAETALLRDRDALERLVATALLARRAPAPSAAHAARAEALTRAAGPLVTADARARARAARAFRTQEADLHAARFDLAAVRTAIEAERSGVITLVAARRTEQSALIETARAADQRAAQYAREARTLRELAQRVQPNRRVARGGDPAPALGPLRAPIEGTLVRAYGAQTAAGHPAQGLTWRGAPGALVNAPAAGVVGYAGLFRSYGQILILNLDNGYVLVLTGMDEVRARTGERVRAGQVIGALPRAATAPPELYVEVRRDGRPIDPSRRFVASPQTAAERRSG